MAGLREISMRIMTRRPKKSRTFTSFQGWKEIGGKKIFFRSGWEVKYAVYLQFLKESHAIKEWEHEPKTFWFDEIKRGVRSFLPDFRVTREDGTQYWVEVKGYMDPKSRTKIKRFGKYYPDEKLYIADKKWFDDHKQIPERALRKGKN